MLISVDSISILGQITPIKEQSGNTFKFLRLALKFIFTLKLPLVSFHRNHGFLVSKLVRSIISMGLQDLINHNGIVLTIEIKTLKLQIVVHSSGTLQGNCIDDYQN